MTKKLITALLLLYAILSPASAQRTMSGRPSLRFTSLYNGQSVGAEAFFAQYTLSGFWEVGLTGDNNTLPFSNTNLCLLDVTMRGAYLFRVVATRNRALNLNIGAGALAGIERLDPFGQIPDYINLSASKTNFIYGLYAVSELEWFFTRHVGAVIQGSLPMVFGSYRNLFQWNIGLGLKIII